MRTFSVLILCGCVLQAAAPSVEAAKQLLEAQWMVLKPTGVKDRTVLFQNVRYLGSTGEKHQYEVSVLVHDYDAGYPPNRYFGQTCVGRADKLTYVIAADAKGWVVQGRMTLDSKCQQNMADGVASVPLASLPGAPASKQAAIPKATLTRSTGGVPVGPYQCWSFSSARPALNFTILANGQYKDSENKPGTFTVDGSGRVTFRGGMLDGVFPEGVYAQYHEPQGHPTVSIRNKAGGEISFCEH